MSIKVKPGCNKKFAIRVEGLDLPAVQDLVLIFRSEYTKGEPLLTYQLNQQAQINLRLREGLIHVSMPPSDTGKFPPNARIWMDILPVMLDGYRPAVSVQQLTTINTLKEEV